LHRCNLAVVYVKTTVKRRGEREYTYLSLVEAVRDGKRVTQRTLLRLGEVSELRETGQLDRIIEALSRHASGTWCQASSISAAPDAPAVGAVAAAYAYWCRLGLDAHFSAIGRRRRSPSLPDAVFVMVANRLIDPCSKRKAIGDWLGADVVIPDGVASPELDQCYRALDLVADEKDATEAHLYSEICTLTDLDLRLGLYDLTSTYFEGDPRPSDRFPSKAFGYSRDHRSDRPQVMLGLLTTTGGIPICHHVFPGNTRDSTTLPLVVDDLASRFRIGGVCLVADRGIITADNLETLSDAGIDYVLATRLHRDALCEAALSATTVPSTEWVAVPDAHSFATEVVIDGTRCVVVASPERYRRDKARTEELIAATEERLLGLENRVRDGGLVDPGKIGRAAQRILGASGVGRLFDVEIEEGRFLYHYDEQAMDYDRQLLCGRYVLTTSLGADAMSTGSVVTAYRGLLDVEDRFRELKDFLGLRPVRHFTETRVRGHIGVCVLAATIEALMTRDLRGADLRDPDLAHQQLTARRALRELDRVRRVVLTAGDHTIGVVTRRNAFQAKLLKTFGVDTHAWDTAQIS
jgi:transposase